MYGYSKGCCAAEAVAQRSFEYTLLNFRQAPLAQKSKLCEYA